MDLMKLTHPSTNLMMEFYATQENDQINTISTIYQPKSSFTHTYMKEEKKRQIRKKDKSSGVGLTCIQSCHVYIKSILSRLNVSYSVPELSFQDFDHSKDPTSGSQLAFPLKPPATLKLEENLICSQWNSPGSCLFFRDVIKSLEPSTVN